MYELKEGTQGEREKIGTLQEKRKDGMLAEVQVAPPTGKRHILSYKGEGRSKVRAKQTTGFGSKKMKLLAHNSIYLFFNKLCVIYWQWTVL